MIAASDAARLRAVEVDVGGAQRWPRGENRGFVRRGATTYVVEEWTTTGLLEAAVTTRGTATLRDDDRVDVVVRARVRWLGWLLVAIGVGCLAVVPRDGLGVGLLGVGIIGAAWALFLRSGEREAALDGVEEVLRREIGGDWRPVDREGRPRSEETT